MKILFDSHTHINNDGYSEEERAQLIAAIEDSEVAYVKMCIRDSCSASRKAAALMGALSTLKTAGDCSAEREGSLRKRTVGAARAQRRRRLLPRTRG